MWIVVPLVGLLVAALPLLAWWRLARTRAIGLPVGALLLAAAAVLVAVQNRWIDAPRADIHLLYTAGTLLLVVLVTGLERQQEGPADPEWRHRRGTAIGILIFQFCFTLLTSLAFLVATSEASTPPADDVPTLPPGLTVLARSNGCGSGNCYRILDIGSDTGLNRAQILAALDHPKETCHPNGWLLDRRPLCTGIDNHGPNVRLYITLGNVTD